MESVTARMLLSEWPLLQMALLLAASGAWGFAANVSMHQLGLLTMWIRYALSLLVTYSVFLGLVRVWITLQRRRLSALPEETRNEWVQLSETERLAAPFRDDSSSVDFHGLSALGELLGEVFPLAVVLTVLGIAVTILASLFYSNAAAGFLAEVCVDGVLCGALYRKIKLADRRHWLESSIRRTAIPALCILAVVVSVAAVVQHFIPQATTVADVIRLTGATPSP